MSHAARLATLLAALLLTSCAPEPRTDVVPAVEGLRVCPGPSIVRGVDVSSYQGTINWPMVAASGRGFAIARIGDGLGHDSTFNTNYAGIAAAGMIRGSYQYWRAGADPAAQADIVIAAVPSLGVGDLPPVADVETADGVSAATLVANLHTWVDQIHAHYGRDPIIYTSYGLWSSIAADSADFASLPLWVANWAVTCPTTPTAWTSWIVWQDSDSGSVPGITGAVDTDRFNGSMAALMMMTGGGTTTPIYAASYVAQSFPLSSAGSRMLAVGDTFAESMDLRNSGTAPWDEHTCLAATVPRDRSSSLLGPGWPSPSRLACVAPGMTVIPGSTYHFAFTVRGNAVGHYDEHFGMVEDGAPAIWFSDPGEGGPADDLFEGIWDVTPGDGGITMLPDAGLPGTDAGMTGTDAGMSGGDAGGASHDAGASGDGAATGDGGGRGPARGGCCHVAGSSGTGNGGALAFAGLAGLVVLRRKARRAR